MKKLYIGLLATGLLLTACSHEQVEGQKTNNHKAETTKTKHQVTKQNGVTKVDDVMLVNKQVAIDQNYNQGEDKIARMHLDQMLEDARKQGLDIVYRSGFRSYQEQVKLYNSYVQRDGEAAAQKYSAPPGYSEHQTGLAFDVGSNHSNTDFTTDFGQTKEGQWLAQHAHEYGFILRYPKGKEAITGYQYEPWHFRYVGKSLATKIYNQHTTLEEYLNYGYDKKNEAKSK